jgi:organic radical activating enzyme
MYIEQGCTFKDIASTIGVSENTVSTWGKKYNWKNRKINLDAAPHKIKELLLGELELVLEGGKPTFNSDDIAKITRALERVDKKVSTQMIISVMKEFDSYLLSTAIDNEVLKKCLDLHKQFIHHRIQNS